MRNPIVRPLFALLGSVVFLAACNRPVRPDDMSTQAHRREAEHERAEASSHTRKFDPNAHVIQPRTPVDVAAVGAEQAYAEYNPTIYHVNAAEGHRAHALEHEHAAAQLEAFEDAECRPFSPGVRASCPFMGPIRSVEDIDGGVRLHLAAGAPVAVVAAHMRCHFAFARSHAFAVSECPLTLRGTDVTVSAQGTAIDVTTGDHKTMDELRRRARALVSSAH